MPDTLVKEFSLIQAREDVQAIIDKAGLTKHFRTQATWQASGIITVSAFIPHEVGFETPEKELSVIDRLYRSLHNVYGIYTEAIPFSPAWETRPPEDENPPQRWAVHVYFFPPLSTNDVPKFPFKTRPA